jgi:hypothetical protein
MNHVYILLQYFYDSDGGNYRTKILGAWSTFEKAIAYIPDEINDVEYPDRKLKVVKVSGVSEQNIDNKGVSVADAKDRYDEVVGWIEMEKWKVD